MASELAKEDCVPCRGGVPAVTGEERARLEKEVPSWRVIEDHHLSRTFTFEDFKAALAFVVKVGEMAEAQGHHPDVHLTWGRATIEIWTHAIDGLTPSDFVFAAKCDALYQ